MAKPRTSNVTDADRKKATGTGMARNAAEKADDRQEYQDFVARQLANDPNAAVPTFEEWKKQKRLQEDEQESGGILDALF